MPLRDRARMKQLIRTNQNQAVQTFAARAREEAGTYIGGDRVVVGNRTYRFRDTQGIRPKVGQRIRVRNVGRPAAALYAPTEGT